ncbi:putative F-box protein At1g65770 [Rhododendron vialii]|uniref:putative F-box protein At1g65770 n=1 Tax=Rhododendron vialii TaxID=182163 RepID=UPI00265DBA7C|nr:putative F-box protein At1g65770 [Rhododendron vialii]
MAPLKAKNQTHNSRVSPYPSSTLQSPLQKTPFLILLPSQEETHEEHSVFFLNLDAKRVHRTKNALNRQLCRSRFIGSSHGWLLLLDECADPYLFEPFSCRRVSLLPKETFPHIIGVSGSPEHGFDVEYVHGARQSHVQRSVTAKELQECLVLKAILSSDPSHGNGEDYLVMAIYGCDAKVAMCKHGDSAWNDLNGQNRPYCDIICHKNRLFALSETGSVESWDFGGPLLVKTMNFHPLYICSKRVAETTCAYHDRERFSSRCYLAESRGNLLLVERHVGEFVGDNGEAVREADLLSDECSHPLVYPYKTLEFTVYRLNFMQQKLEEVESLGDNALFLGGNHSMSLPAAGTAQHPSRCKKNSIYFTDDYWERMEEDYSYGGHDVGVFSLGDRSVKPLKHLDMLHRTDPPPIWLVPNNM